MSKRSRPSIVDVILLAILAGVLFPLLMTAAARRIFPAQPHADETRQNGESGRSERIAEGFTPIGKLAVRTDSLIPVLSHKKSKN